VLVLDLAASAAVVKGRAKVKRSISCSPGCWAAARRGEWLLRVCAIATTFYIPFGCLQAQEIDPKEFRALYEKATAKLASYYDHAGMVVNYRRKNTSAQPSRFKDRDTASRMVYRAKDPQYLLQINPDKAGSSREERVLLLTKGGVFHLTKADRASAYLLVGLDDNYTEAIGFLQEEVQAPGVAFRLGAFRLLGLFTSPAMQVTKCARRGNHYIVDYLYLSRGERVPSQLVLDADRCMAQLEHSRSAREWSWKFTVEYKGEAKGVPLPSRCWESRCIYRAANDNGNLAL
jgi:hypothetical protein